MTRLCGAGMMVANDPIGGLCRVGVRVKHGLRYTYIAGVISVQEPASSCESGEHSKCTRSTVRLLSEAGHSLSGHGNP